MNLVFDMHNEYGWQGTQEGGPGVKGLKQLFPSQVSVFSLDAEMSRWRGLSPDAEVQIGFGEIEPQDIETLAETLNLTPQGVSAVYSLVRRFGQEAWLEEFLARESREELATLADETSELFQVLFTLHRRLARPGPYALPGAQGPRRRRATHPGVPGTGASTWCWSSDATATTSRRTSWWPTCLPAASTNRYVQRMEQATGGRAQEPHPLLITIEEAHRFLTPAVASQTIFGTIAREMRKYKVSLLVVDQRPSGIDEEVRSQLGTRFAYLLDNERDVDAVLAGAPGARELRTVLSKLDSQQQALVFGHALPMPVVIRTRDYGTEESYREFGFRDAAELKRQVEEDAKDLFG